MGIEAPWVGLCKEDYYDRYKTCDTTYDLEEHDEENEDEEESW